MQRPVRSQLTLHRGLPESSAAKRLPAGVNKGWTLVAAAQTADPSLNTPEIESQHRPGYELAAQYECEMSHLK